MKYRTTIKDIARALNIHHTTVSRALRDHPDVNPQTKKLVKAMAEKLNYQPNIVARNLKTNSTNLIGVIVPEIKHHFFAAVISGIEDVAYRAGYIILVCQSNEQYEREVMNTRALISNKVAGLIVSISQNTRNGNHFKLFQEQGGKIVFFDRVCEDLDAPKVVVDDYQGAFKATEYLIKKGYRRIAHIGGTEHLTVSLARYRGYRDALKKHSIEFRPEYVVFSGFHESDGREGMQRLLSATPIPDALFAVNDPVALGSYDVIKSHGLQIPADIAVIGFSNNPISAVINPPLTTIEQPSYEMGKYAAEMLIQLIKNENEKEFETRRVLKTRLIERASA